MLLILMFFVAVVTFSMMAALPAMLQQAKRDREEEMIHRGTEYARAIKKYYKKFNSYPNSIEALENTNNIRFLRRRYKDPMMPGGNWKLLHLTDVQQGVSNPNFGVSQAGNFNPSASAGGALSQQGPQPGMAGATQVAVQTTGGSATGSLAGTSSNSNSSSSDDTNSSSPTGQPGQTIGGGGIVGVESLSKAKSIRVFGNKSNYNKWMFIYDPTQDRGTLLKGPYNPQAFQGGTGNNTNGQPGTSTGGAFGNSFGNSFGSQPGNQQPQNNNGPGSNMPPDQNAPPQ